MKRELAEVHDVRQCADHFFHLGRVIRDSILNIPNRLAAVLASETDMHTIHALLLKELNLALEGLAHAQDVADA